MKLNKIQYEALNAKKNFYFSFLLQKRKYKFSTTETTLMNVCLRNEKKKNHYVFV